MTALQKKVSILDGTISVKWVLLFIAVIVGLVIKICTPDPQKSTITLTDPIQTPVAVAFYDANPTIDKNVPDVTVTLVDDERGYLRTSSGTTEESLELENGVMSLALTYKNSDGDTFAVTPEHPYRFRIKSEAPGYIPTWTTIVLTSKNPVFRPVYMVAERENMPGLSVTQTNLSVTEGGVVQNTDSVLTSIDSNLKEQLKIKIPKGTRLLCVEGGKPDFTQDVRARVLYVNPLDSMTGRIFPNGFEVTDMFDRNGNKTSETPANPSIFQTAGWFTAEILVGENEVTSFSEPIEARMEINPGLINPTEKRVYQSGDTIPLLSIDEKSGAWFEEGKATIQKSGNKLFAEFKLKHLSTFNLDFKGDRCSPVQFSLTGGAAANTNYYVDVYSVQNTTDDPPILTGQFDRSRGPFVGPGPHTFLNMPNENNPFSLFMVAFDEAQVGVKGVPVGSNQPFELPANCQNLPNIDIPIVAGNSCGITLQVQIIGTPSGTTTLPVCNNAVWVKQGSCGAAGSFRNAGFLEDGNPVGTGAFETLTAQPDNSYCFEVWFATNPIRVELDLNTATPNVLNIHSPSGATTFSFARTSGATDCPRGYTLTLRVPDAVIPTCP